MPARPVAVLVAAAALLAAACTSTINGAASPATGSAPTATADPSLAPDRIEATVRAAALAASAVHAKGTITEDNTAIAIDLQVNANSAAGTIAQNNTTLPVRYVNQVYYLQFTAPLLAANGIVVTSPTGQALLNKWVPSTAPIFPTNTFADFKAFLDYDSFVTTVFGTPDSDAFTVTGRDTVNGVPVLIYHDTTENALGYVAAAKPHYLMRITLAPGSRAGDGTLDLTNWNQPTQITAPAPTDTYTGN